ncbi:hypothetical protein WUBG_11572 [Wuchereria bancrofti]|uniref:Uncharacterized protein n=1 Tax=Wuchereria bancrofti TaxID=6293 RepID=J9E5U7_WUCBA|nr:hypothetical protein WUBG_11572 [Wuchereria bancrofti]
MPECDCRTIPLIQNPRLVTDRTLWPAPFMKPKRASLFYWTIMTVLSSFVDTSEYTLFN